MAKYWKTLSEAQQFRFQIRQPGSIVSMAMFLLLIKTHKISHGAWLQKGNENLNMCIFEESRPVNIYLPWLWSISAVERSTAFIPPSLICPWSSPARPYISFHQLPSPSFSFPSCSPLLQSLSVTSPSWKDYIQFNGINKVSGRVFTTTWGESENLCRWPISALCAF